MLYFSRMDDLEKYIAKRKKRSRVFARIFEVRYENFKIAIFSTKIEKNRSVDAEHR